MPLCLRILFMRPRPAASFTALRTGTPHAARHRMAYSPGAGDQRFFGIVIRMFYDDHMPAHFHAVYGDEEALIEIDTLAVYRGNLPRRALALVLEWAALHREELRQDWELARSGEPPNPINPLD